MEQSGIQEILKALELHSAHVDKKIDQLKVDLETRMDKRFDEMNKRFDRQDKKFNGVRVELAETQETVDYLSTKNVQHEKKLRTIYEQ
ncbi:MAG TPA: hypothetical protein VK108_06090 [Pseudogracilibacillus sp.]|nr:hypothetical protein [Pseudogracilibacillus sp.]